MMYESFPSSLAREMMKVFSILDPLGSSVNRDEVDEATTIDDENAIDVEWREVE